MAAPPGPWLMMATPVSASRSAVRSALSIGTEPRAKAWLTATLPCRPAPGAFGNGADLGEAAFAAVMQMDVDAHAGRLGDGEDRVEMAIEVAVDPNRIEAAQKVGALGDGSVQKLRRARRAQDAALREGHDLDGHEIAEAFTHLEDLMEVRSPSWLSMSTWLRM